MATHHADVSVLFGVPAGSIGSAGDVPEPVADQTHTDGAILAAEHAVTLGVALGTRVRVPNVVWVGRPTGPRA